MGWSGVRKLLSIQCMLTGCDKWLAFIPAHRIEPDLLVLEPVLDLYYKGQLRTVYEAHMHKMRHVTIYHAHAVSLELYWENVLFILSDGLLYTKRRFKIYAGGFLTALDWEYEILRYAGTVLNENCHDAGMPDFPVLIQASKSDNKVEWSGIEQKFTVFTDSALVYWNTLLSHFRF